MTAVLINYDLCDECGTCVSVCRHDAVILADRLRVSDKCVSCGVCVSVCPVGALTKGDDRGR